MSVDIFKFLRISIVSGFLEMMRLSLSWINEVENSTNNNKINPSKRQCF